MHNNYKLISKKLFKESFAGVQHVTLQDFPNISDVSAKRFINNTSMIHLICIILHVAEWTVCNLIKRYDDRHVCPGQNKELRYNIVKALIKSNYKVKCLYGTKC